jgi:2-polyprenyl-3-methyl-5-hydroxy-6-metoxy-1,4-benzoquinol methylase
MATTQPGQEADRPVESAARQIDQARMEEFLGKMVTDLGAAVSVVMVAIGDRLGLYRAMADAGPITSQELARRTGTVERYVREWLVNQAAGGYVSYDPATGTYTLPNENAAALADENGPFFAGGGFQLFNALFKSEPRISDDFRTGRGMGWGEHDPGLFAGTERFFRAGYLRDLVTNWIPALEGGVQAKLERGAEVADVGCGHGASTVLMARAFPQSRFTGFDNHAPSIDHARQAARDAGVTDNVIFGVADSSSFGGGSYDLVAFFDCLHDLADPVGAVRRAHETLKADGTLMIVEPMAGETVEQNLNPVGRLFSGASVLCCMPNSLAGGGPALGTIAPDAELEAVVKEGGFTSFRRAAETPFNRVFEARG